MRRSRWLSLGTPVHPCRNGYLGGFGSFEDVQEAVNNIGLSAQTRDRLLAGIRKQGERHGTSAFCTRKL